MAQESFLRSGKKYIDMDDTHSFDQLVESYIVLSHERGYQNFAGLYKDLFIHMCLRGRLAMAKKFHGYYQQMNIVDRVVVKGMFPYCITIARNKKDKEMMKWLEKVRDN